MSRREFLVGAPLVLVSSLKLASSITWFQKFWQWAHRRRVGWQTFYKSIILNTQFGVRLFEV